MQRHAKYPLVKENKAMMTTKKESCLKKTVHLESLMLHIMIRGMKITRRKTTTGNRGLSFDGCKHFPIVRDDGDLKTKLLLFPADSPTA